MPEHPRLGMLWGDFPWDDRARKMGKLLSMGAVGRTTTRALSACGRVVPFIRPPSDAPQRAHRAALEAFLRSIDVLFADVYAASGPALELRHELGLHCPAVLFAGGAMPKGADAMLFPWQHLLRAGDGVWFTSRADQAIWRRLVTRSALHEWVVPLGVDETLFRLRDPSERGAVRRRHGLPIATPLLLAVGRINVQKNLHSVLHLHAAVRRQVPDAHLCFVGEEDDIGLHEFGVLNTGYGAWLRDQAAELGIADAVTFAGPLFGNDLARLYAASDVLVSASVYHRENFGLAPAEAQACGVPVVCSAWNGFKDVVRDGETGFLMDAVLTRHGVRVDWASGAQRVVTLLRDPPRRAAMGHRAAAWASERFSVAALSRALEAVVTDATRPPAGRPRKGMPTPDIADDTRTAAYATSGFARRYEAHKRACGWYGATPESLRLGTPPMFQGKDYRLYLHLMGPLASGMAGDRAPGGIQPPWVPYFASPVLLDDARQLIESRDPIWPHRRFCRPLQWAVARRVDGRAAVRDVIAAVAAKQPEATPAAVGEVLQQLHADGFVLFQRDGCDGGPAKEAAADQPR